MNDRPDTPKVDLVMDILLLTFIVFTIGFFFVVVLKGVGAL